MTKMVCLTWTDLDRICEKKSNGSDSLCLMLCRVFKTLVLVDFIHFTTCTQDTMKEMQHCVEFACGDTVPEPNGRHHS